MVTSFHMFSKDFSIFFRVDDFDLSPRALEETGPFEVLRPGCQHYCVVRLVTSCLRPQTRRLDFEMSFFIEYLFVLDLERFYVSVDLL